MAAVIDPAVVEYEYDRKQPYYRCLQCDTKETQRGMEDHLVRRHSSVPAPFECRECSKHFYRRDAACGHTTKQHSRKNFKEVIQENKVGSTWLMDHAVLLTWEEGLLAAQDELLAGEQCHAWKSSSQAAPVSTQPKQTSKAAASPSQSIPPATSTSTSSVSQPSPATSVSSPVDSPACKTMSTPNVPAIPDLVLHPPTDNFRLTPDVPAVDSADNLPEPDPNTIPSACPAMPILLDIMSGLNRLAANQETMMGTINGLEVQQLDIHEWISKLETVVARHGRYCSAAQGENKKLKDSLAELKDDARKAASEGGRAVTESRRATDGIRELKGELVKVMEDSEKLHAEGVSELKGKMAKLREMTEKTLTEVEQVKDDLNDTQDDVRKLSETEDQILEGIRPVNLIRDSTKRIEDNMRTVATTQTRTVARSRAAFREILHGVSRSLDAFENRPNAHQIACNDSGRTEREQHAQRPLDL